MKTGEHILFENTPATYFTEAYPIGNGRLGGMVYGQCDRMRIGLNHDELWAGMRWDNTKDYDKEKFEELQSLALSGKYLDAHKLYEAELAKHDGGSYLTLGDLFIELPDGEVSSYRRELNLRDGVATVSYILGNSRVSVEFISSYPAGVMLIRLVSEEPIDFALSPELTMIRESYSYGKQTTFHGECPIHCERHSRPGNLPFDTNGRSGIKFCSVLRVESDGEVIQKSGRTEVSSATESTVYFATETSYENGSECGKDNYEMLAVRSVDSAVAKGYDLLRAEHISDVRELYDRVSFTVQSQDFSDIATSKRIKAFSMGGADYSLVPLYFNMGRYLLIASSRPGARAANLQGIWNDKMNPPWSSNYTTNINTEMNYWSALPCAMPELIEPLESLVRVISSSGEETARELYGKGGFTASHNTDIFGFSTPTGGRACWSCFPVSAGWLSRELYNKYEYTLDREYLKSVYDIFEGVCEFYLDMLVDDGEYLIITPGASAENMYVIDGQKCALAKSSTIFASIVRDSISSFVRASEVLSVQSELVDRAKAALPRLLPIRITSDGRIEEWYFGGVSESPEESEITHRHISHLYDLYPAKRITAETPELFSAAKESLRVRGDDASGWSLVWKMLCYARLGDGDGVMRFIRLALRPVSPEVSTSSSFGGGVYPNLMCAHPPFQIDGNLAFPAAICEMLVDDEGARPLALPALPRELATGSMKGMMLKGGRRADISWCDGKIVEFKIYQPKKETEK